ncbi:MAG TPA: hypothetical protein VFB74_05210 [Kribbellaceae bacterium]|jgi:hypothetical protein|nr:hypothetical protein [Kribbellaceae bacterium]
MKTLGVALGTAGLAAAGLTVHAPSAPAAAAPAAAAACSGSALVSANYVRLFGGSPVVGAIQLRRDSCYRYWGVITMYEPMKANTFAIAYIIKYTSGRKGKPISCDASGGNGRVVRGQTTCRTPKLGGRPSNITFVASGHEFQNGGGGWTRISWGQTRRMR